MKFTAIRTISTVILGAALLLTGCESPSTPSGTDSVSGTTVHRTAPAKSLQSFVIAPTAASTVTATLWADKSTDVGTVSVTRNDANLTVTYTVTGGRTLDETHLNVATTPFSKRGAPGQYTYSAEHARGTTSYSYIIPITWAEGTVLSFIAHAEVKGAGKEASAFAGTITEPKRGAWFGQFTFTIEPTTPPPPPTYTVSGTAFFDTNNDGLYTAGEPALAGLTIELSNGDVTVTNANGSYSFSGLTPDTYTVIGPSIDGYYPTSTLTKKFSISTADYSANFGYTDIAP